MRMLQDDQKPDGPGCLVESYVSYGFVRASPSRLYLLTSKRRSPLWPDLLQALQGCLRHQPRRAFKIPFRLVVNKSPYAHMRSIRSAEGPTELISMIGWKRSANFRTREAEAIDPVTWKVASDASGLINRSLSGDAPERPLVEPLVPLHDDYIVLKPKHSAFYTTPLDALLSYLQARTMILVGLTQLPHPLRRFGGKRTD